MYMPPKRTPGQPAALPLPAIVYLQRDASDLARACYGLTITEVCRRLHVEKRVFIAELLIARGWPVADVSRALRYSHSAALYYHLKGA